MSAEPVSPEESLLGSFLLGLHMLCVPTSLVSLRLLTRPHSYCIRAHPNDHSTSIIYLKAPSPSITTVGLGASTWEFGGDTTQSITDPMFLHIKTESSRRSGSQSPLLQNQNPEPHDF